MYTVKEINKRIFIMYERAEFWLLNKCIFSSVTTILYTLFSSVFSMLVFALYIQHEKHLSSYLIICLSISV